MHMARLSMMKRSMNEILRSRISSDPIIKIVVKLSKFILKLQLSIWNLSIVSKFYFYYELLSINCFKFNNKIKFYRDLY